MKYVVDDEHRSVLITFTGYDEKCLYLQYSKLVFNMVEACRKGNYKAVESMIAGINEALSLYNSRTIGEKDGRHDD